VPVVIRNAEIVASRNSTTINPGTVDVAVFPPIPVDDWTLDTLPEHIAAVRQLYLDTLADWPVHELPKVDLHKLAKKAAPRKSANKKSANKTAAKKPKPSTKKGAAKKTNPNESEVALKDGEAHQSPVARP
jgi:putative phosphoserine phosphatase/1-acylglycerol-3-phosphate O-acyltransferase